MYFWFLKYAVDMAVQKYLEPVVKVADEVFLVVATLHRKFPDAPDFSVDEIVAQAREMRIHPTLRPGLEVHIRQHCVANKRPNPGNYRVLFATMTSRRRLLQPGDAVHPDRTGKQFPELSQVPAQYHELIEWAKSRTNEGAEPISAIDALLAMRGAFRYTRPGQSVDDYVRELREGWE